MLNLCVSILLSCAYRSASTASTRCRSLAAPDPRSLRSRDSCYSSHARSGKKRADLSERNPESNKRSIGEQTNPGLVARFGRRHRPVLRKPEICLTNRPFAMDRRRRDTSFAALTRPLRSPKCVFCHKARSARSGAYIKAIKSIRSLTEASAQRTDNRVLPYRSPP